jgi:uncharacterized membrane protein YfcA
MIHAALAWGGAVIIGVSLGLLGSGGSILTVPVLVYLFGQDEKLAIAGSLAVVGLIAGVGAGAALRRGQFNVRAWLSLAAPGLGGAALGAWASHLVSGRIQLGTFALIMLAAGAAMLRRPADALPTSPPAPPHTALPLPLLLAIGAVLGVITGFVGVGGGFLVVPALVVAARLAPRIATGTSLGVIAVNSAVGFAAHYRELSVAGLQLDWLTLGAIAAVGIVGSVGGQRLADRLSATTLRKLFGVTVIVIAVAMLADLLR